MRESDLAAIGGVRALTELRRHAEVVTSSLRGGFLENLLRGLACLVYQRQPDESVWSWVADLLLKSEPAPEV